MGCTHNCSTCSHHCGGEGNKTDFVAKPNDLTHVKKIIAVVSGKGGVGKSSITSMLAVKANRNGLSTAILDADITGPSIPKAFGIKDKAFASEQGIFPASSEGGIKVMSTNMLLENDTDPVIWRGPVIAGTVKQFWTDVIWDDVDMMFIDMPPGTGDVPLTVFQSLPIDGIVIVTSPQELVSMIVGKAVKMAGKMNIPVLGIVENMSYFECSKCHEKHYIFGKSHLKEIAAKYDINNIVQLPMDEEIANLCDNGKIEDYDPMLLNTFLENLNK
ncbi:MAG: Mrp/NBP35 family ATP-binding protein [Alphaproteobacteria bacterium]|nr:Mrp/NBP35 family ATP-binding protein [Alphaproteobacteria bacterium]